MLKITRKTYDEFDAELVRHVQLHFKMFLSDNIVYCRESGIIWPIMHIINNRVHLIFAMENFQREYPSG